MPEARTPRIIFVPGKNPKPPPEVHRAHLWRCLLEGVRRARPDVHADLQVHADAFSVVPWNYSYYGCERPADLDAPWIEAVIRQPGATEQDRREARQWRNRVMRFLYLVADSVPALIPLVPDPKMKATVAETLRYFDNRDGVAELVRRPMERMFHEVCELGVPFMIIGHSLGSVIAWDALWKLSHEGTVGCRVDLFLTIGSPLGTRFVQRRLLGHGARGAKRYPSNIRRWRNITAVGDLTTVDPRLCDDFRGMIRYGLVEDIRDNSEPVYNWYRTDQGLNAHRSYGYLVNPAVGRVIAEWWEEKSGYKPQATSDK